MKPRTRKELRCECRARHLLAFYGMTSKGEPYLHVMSHRQGRVTSNVVIFGDCEIQCPSCNIWHILTFGKDGRMKRDATLKPPPESVRV